MHFFKKYPNLRNRLVIEFFFGLFFWMYLPYLAIYFSHELGKNTAGMLLVASQFVSVVVGLFGGYFADTKGRKTMMVTASFIQCFGMLILAISVFPSISSPWLAFIGFTFVSLSDSLYRPASSAMVVDTVEDDKERQTVFSIFYTNLNLTVIFGPLIGGLFFFTHRFELFAVSFFVFLICTIFLTRYLEETRIGDATKKEKTKTVFLRQVKQYQVIFTDRLFLLFILAGILLAQTFMQMDLLLAVSIEERVKNGQQLFSWVVMENGLFVALFTILVTKWMKRYSDRSIFIWSSLFYAISMAIFGYFTSPWLTLFAMMIFTFAELMSVGVQQNFIAEIAPEDKRGQYFAAGGLRFSVGRMIAPLMIPLTALIGYEYTFLVITLLAVFAAYLYHVIYKKRT